MPTVTVKARGFNSYAEWNVLHFARVADAEVDHAGLQARAMKAVEEDGWHEAIVTVDGVRVYGYCLPLKHTRRKAAKCGPK